jgi:hypothetical protein
VTYCKTSLFQDTNSVAFPDKKEENYFELSCLIKEETTVSESGESGS